MSKQVLNPAIQLILKGHYPDIKRSDREAGHSHLLPRLGMCGAALALSHTPLYRDAQSRNYGQRQIYVFLHIPLSLLDRPSSGHS
jgi:hypothetical protein